MCVEEAWRLKMCGAWVPGEGQTWGWPDEKRFLQTEEQTSQIETLLGSKVVNRGK